MVTTCPSPNSTKALCYCTWKANQHITVLICLNSALPFSSKSMAMLSEFYHTTAETLGNTLSDACHNPQGCARGKYSKDDKSKCRAACMYRYLIVAI